MMDLIANGMLALVVFGAGMLGSMLTFAGPATTAIWPPAGIAVATFLLGGRRFWPGILVGAFFVSLVTFSSLPASLLIAAGSTLEGLIAAHLIDRLAHGPHAFDRGSDILGFAFLGGLLSTTVGATIAAISLMMTGLVAGSDYTHLWLTWWFADAAGVLMVTPVILLWALNPHWNWGRKRTFEAIRMAATAILLGLIVFGGFLPFGLRDYSLEFILLPVVAWAALRFGQREAATITLFLTVVAIIGSLHGFGPFARVSSYGAVLLLQLFMGAMTILGIGLAAVVAERKQTDASLREANDKLVQGLSEVERRNREMAFLNEMTDLLQSCLTVAEAEAVITQSVPKLFPGRAGGLYVLSISQNMVEAIALWGDHPPAQRVFAPDDCWALRRGRTHVLSANSTSMRCSHLMNPAPRAALCLPMIAQGEILGILHLQSMLMDDFPQAQLQLAQAVADSVALALANLRLRETLRQQSIRDPLTELFNRRYLEEALERELLRSSRNQTQVGVMLLDIDHFKDFNDSFGHTIGDLLLRELGSFLKRGIRGGDIACRYGGEEFLLLLPDTTPEILLPRAEQVRREVKKMHVPDHGELSLSISVSIGVAIYPQNGSTGEAILQAADEALYRAKNEGRDRVIVADVY